MLSTAYRVYQRVYYFFQRNPPIFTLDPNKFAEKNQRPLRIANQKTFDPRIVLHNNRLGTVVGPHIHYDTSGKKFTPFPPNTKAFLYYSTLPGRPRIGGELRLRVTSRDDPASFESGYDLLGLNGQPWSRPLFMLSRCSSYIPLYKKLRKEGLVQDDLDAFLSTFPSSFGLYYRGQQLYTLNDTFMVDFSSENVQFTVITEQGVEILQFNSLFRDNRNEMCGIAPYRGAYTNYHLG